VYSAKILVRAFVLVFTLHVDAGHHLEQLAGERSRRSDPARRLAEFARVDFGVGARGPIGPEPTDAPRTLDTSVADEVEAQRADRRSSLCCAPCPGRGLQTAGTIKSSNGKCVTPTERPQVAFHAEAAAPPTERSPPGRCRYIGTANPHPHAGLGENLQKYPDLEFRFLGGA
jgi:hypothetical protein